MTTKSSPNYLAEQIPTVYRFDKVVRRRGKKKVRITQIGFVKVKLPSTRDKELTMIVCRFAGHDKPMMLLTNLSVEDAKDAKHVLRLYI